LCCVDYVGCADSDRSRYRGHTEEDEGASRGAEPGATSSQDAADGAAGLYWHHCQPGEHRSITLMLRMIAVEMTVIFTKQERNNTPFFICMSMLFAEKVRLFVYAAVFHLLCTFGQ